VYFFAVLPAVAILPPRVKRSVVCRLGKHLYEANGFHREATRVSLTEVLSNRGYSTQQITDQTVGTFETLVAEDMDAYCFPFWNSRNIGQYYEFEGLDHLDMALKRRKGALLFTGHVGRPCASLVALGLSGYPVTHLSRDSRREKSLPAPFRTYARFKLKWMKKGSGRELAFIDQDDYAQSSIAASLRVCQLLSKNEVVSMAIDVPPPLVKSTETCWFLNRQCRFPTGLVQLAYQTGAPVLPFFALGDDESRTGQKLIVQEEVKLCGDVGQDLQQCVDRLSQVILESPEQWLSWDSFRSFWSSDEQVRT